LETAFAESPVTCLSLTAGNHARHPLMALCSATSFGRGALCCVCATGVVETMTSKYGVRSAVRPIVSVGCSTLPRGSGAKARTELGFLGFSCDFAVSGYLPRIRVVLTFLASAPRPRVARCEKAIPPSSAETSAVCRVPKKPRCRIATPETCPSVFLSSRPARSSGGMCRKGFAGFESSQVKMWPVA
jgi:hypothetical protein